MKLSTKGRYGVRAMIDLAAHYDQGPIMLKDVAGRIQVSRKYLEQLVISLRTSGLVRSIRGAHGGYVLAMPPEDIRLRDVVRVLEGSISPVECVDDPGICEMSDRCATHDIWMEMRDAMEDILNSLNLADMVKRQEAKLRAQG